MNDEAAEGIVAFGEYVRHRREAMGLLQIELARLSGLSKGHVSAIESCKTGSPTLATVAGIARALGVSLAEVVSSVDSPPNTALADAYARIAELEETIRALAVAHDHAVKGLRHQRAILRRAKVLKE